jgi:hypothetical protein
MDDDPHGEPTDLQKLQADLKAHVPKGYPDPGLLATPMFDPAVSGKMAVLMHMLVGPRRNYLNCPSIIRMNAIL